MWIVCKEQPQKVEIKKNGKRKKGEGLDWGDKWEYVTSPCFFGYLLQRVKEVRVEGMGKQWAADIQKGSWGMIRKSNQHNVHLKWQTFHFRPN